MLAHALAYAGNGWAVFPCEPQGKRPATAHGLKDATTNLDRIERWWRQNPDFNVGIRTGRLVVIDLDEKMTVGIATSNGNSELVYEGHSGFDQWCRLLTEHGADWFETWEVGTPRHGTHIYFDAGDLEVRNSASKLAPCIDVRGHGGYVVAPPSTTADGAYAVEQAPPPAPLPAWLAELLVTPPRNPVDDAISLHHARRLRAQLGGGGSRYGQAALESECDAVSSAVEGCRNATLVRAAFNLGTLVVGARLQVDHVAAALLDAARACGLSETEAVATIRSGLAAGLEKPRTAA